MNRKRRPLSERFWEKVDVRDASECWLWTAKSMVKGYGTIAIGGRDEKKELAHRVAWILVNGPLPTVDQYHGAVVMHLCDNRRCCNPSHLRVGTQAENVSDMDKKGRRVNFQPKGSMHPNAKLSDDQVLAIKNDDRPHRLIAKDYGVTRANISYIKRGSAWKHIK